MKKITVLILFFICIAVVLASGCTSQPAPKAGVTTTTAPTSVQTSAPITVMTTQETPVTPLVTTAVQTASPTTDPILHRWVRWLPDKVNGERIGYEFKFYPGGIVNYRQGTATMVSDNIKITPTSEASGTWSRLDNNTYLIQILPTAESGAKLIREYTHIPSYVDPRYPGVTIPEHIESSYESDAIGKAHIKGPDEMYYPERAKID